MLPPPKVNAPVGVALSLTHSAPLRFDARGLAAGLGATHTIAVKVVAYVLAPKAKTEANYKVAPGLH